MEDIGVVPVQPGQSIFSVEGARVQSRDEADLIKQAKKQLQLHKQATQKLSRVEKGVIADRVLHTGHGEASFAHRLGALLRLGGKPLHTVTVEYRNLRIEADALVGSAGNPSVLNSAKDVLRFVTFQRPPTVPHVILDGVSGVLKPGRMTLLLGPPSGGKSVLLQALSGRLQSGRNLRISGSIKYNGLELDEFQPRRTAGLVKQQDNHLAELTVAETVDFSFRCLVGPQQRTEIYSRIEGARRLLKQQRQHCTEGAAHLADVEGGSGSGGDGHDIRASAATNGSSHAATANGGSRSAADGSDSVSGASGTGGSGSDEGPSRHHLGCAELAADEEFAEAMSEVVGKRLAPYLNIRIMGLAHAAQTQVGSSEVRGISGGERKRLTTAEILVGQQPVLFMDEISTGLDSATAYSVVRTFRSVVHNLQRTFLVSLLQPAPEIIDLFDDLLLLTDGRVIYHGPVKGMLEHFRSLGFVCPTRKDPGSFLQEVTTPTGQWMYASADLLQQHGLTEADRAPQALLAAPPSQLLTSVEDMQHAFWEGTAQGRGMLHQLEFQPYQRNTEGSAAVFTTPYGNSPKVLVREVVRRQFLLNWRMRAFYIARVVQTAIMALIIGSMFARIQPVPSEGRNAVAISVLSAIFLSMNSAPQLAFAQLAKPVFLKQRDNQLFPSWAFSLAQVITQLPQSTVESIVWSSIVYWIVGLTPTAGNFFIYLLVVWSSSNCMASLFRLFGFAGKTMVIANSTAMLTLLLMIVSNGFSIVKPSIPPYIVWLYYINPMAWAIKGLVINELTAARWQYIVPGTNPPETAGDTIMQPFGFPIDRAYIWGAVGYLWGLMVVLTALAALVLRFAQAPSPQPTVPEAEGRKEVSRRLLAALQRQLRSQVVQPLMKRAASMRALSGRHRAPPLAVEDASSQAASSVETGSVQLVAKAKGLPLRSISAVAAPPAVEAPPPAAEKQQEANAAQAAPRRLVTSVREKVHEKLAVPFQPVTLVCKDLRYYVPDPSHGEAEGVVRDAGADKEITGKLELLKGISFFACPGELTALMGGSGAGKTTLMDVVLGRKTVGVIRGDILTNGYPKQQAVWARMCGYVEQQDIHSGRSTVRESLLFSARLRLTGDTPLEQVVRLVDETLEMTELTALQHSIVGEGQGGQGLTVEQMKRLSIAVELVAAPSVIFMDEPTSGLDARAAAVVMRSIQNVVRSNRTVCITIHQPSTEIFEAFDMLILMQLGGRLTYFGPLGFESAALIAYLEAVPGVQQIRPGSNPATWMLEVTGGSMSTIYESSHADFPGVYAASELRRQNEATAERLVEEGQAAHQPLAVPTQYAAPFGLQRRMLLRKYWMIYFRSPHYNFVRLFMAAIIACVYALVYHGQGHVSATEDNPANIGDIQNVMGLLFSSAVFVGMFNAITVQPLVAAERVVFYRERAAMMYAPGPYSLALGLAEIPYLLAQAIVMISVLGLMVFFRGLLPVNITYWAVHFSHTAWKFFYFLLMFMVALIMYTLCGQFLVHATPNQLLAQLMAATLNQLWTISNGFLLPYSAIPRGWKWLNRISPTTWILYGLGESQLGDSSVPMLVFGNLKTTVGQFMSFYFDYDYGFIWYCILIVFAYAVFFRLGSSTLLRFVSWQKR